MSTFSPRSDRAGEKARVLNFREAGIPGRWPERRLREVALKSLNVSLTNY